MKELNDYRKRILDRAAAVLDDLQEAGLRLTEKEWQAQDEDGSTPHQSLSRLAAKEAGLYAPCIQATLDGEGEMPVFDEVEWLARDYRPDENWYEIFEGYAGVCGQILDKVNALDGNAWTKAQRHPWYGERTLSWWFEASLAEAEEVLGILREAQI